MRAATAPPPRRDAVRLLVVDEQQAVDRPFAALVETLAAGDLLVVNDAATLPASLATEVEGQRVELRLVGLAVDAHRDDRWRAVVLGAGDWRDDTDHRPHPPALPREHWLELGCGDTPLRARRVDDGPADARLVTLEFDRAGPPLYAALYRLARPIQYRHLAQPLALSSVQTLFAGRPWAIEMPSAGRPLTARMLAQLRKRGVCLARLTHAAGLSATGDPKLDTRLPLPERYELPRQTVARILATRRLGGRVVAVGTTVVRALEDAALRAGGLPQPGPAVAELVLTAAHHLRVVDGLLTGMHAPGESHHRLLEAFADAQTLARMHERARAAGYRRHEFGDLALLWATRRSPARAA